MTRNSILDTQLLSHKETTTRFEMSGSVVRRQIQSIVVHDGDLRSPSDMWALIEERDALKDENARLEAELQQLQAQLKVARSQMESVDSGESATLAPNTELLESGRIRQAGE